MSTHSSPAKARRRGDVWFALGAIAATAFLAWVVITIQGMAHDLHAKDADVAALAQQVRSLGGKPVAGPTGARGAAGQSIVGARGPQGEPGSPGPTGSPGATGAPGKTGASGTPGVVGASGSPGINGVAGSPGPVGAQGDPGPAGADGKDGADGTNGKDGSPPAGWTYTDAAGTTYDCTPVADFDPNSPRYTCSPTSTPDPSPTPQGLLGAAMFTATASYRRFQGGQLAARRPRLASPVAQISRSANA